MDNLQLSPKTPNANCIEAKESTSDGYFKNDFFNSLVFSCMTARKNVQMKRVQNLEKHGEINNKLMIKNLLIQKKRLLTSFKEIGSTDLDMDVMVNKTLLNLQEREMIRRTILKDKISAVKRELEGLKKIEDKGEYIKKYAQLDHASTLESKNQIVNQAAKDAKMLETKLQHKENYSKSLSKKVTIQTESIHKLENYKVYQKECISKLMERIEWLRGKNETYNSVCAALKQKIDDWNEKISTYLKFYNAKDIKEVVEKQENILTAEEQQRKRIALLLEEMGRMKNRISPFQPEVHDNNILLRDYAISTENELQLLYDKFLQNKENLTLSKNQINDKYSFLQKVSYVLQSIHASWSRIGARESRLAAVVYTDENTPCSVSGISMIFNSINYLTSTFNWETAFKYSFKFKRESDCEGVPRLIYKQITCNFKRSEKILNKIKKIGEKSDGKPGKSEEIDNKSKDNLRKKSVNFVSNEKVFQLPNLKDAIVQQEPALCDYTSQQESFSYKEKNAESMRELISSKNSISPMKKSFINDCISKIFMDYCLTPKSKTENAEDVFVDIKKNFDQYIEEMKPKDQASIKEEENIYKSRGEVMSEIGSYIKSKQGQPMEYIKKLYAVKKSNQETFKASELQPAKPDKKNSDLKNRLQALEGIKNISNIRKLPARYSSLPKLTHPRTAYRESTLEQRQRDFIMTASSFRKGLASYGSLNIKKKPGKLVTISKEVDAIEDFK